jgi:uncharacterized membrane protein YphA (DoxX/SURF4 family)
VKHLPSVAGVLLGLLFVAAGIVVLLGIWDLEPPPESTPRGHFFAALVPTGYLTFVKACEIVGGVFVAIPRTRCLGLLILGPIVANIVAYHVFVADDTIGAPIDVAVCALCTFLVLVEHRAFRMLLTRRPITGDE